MEASELQVSAELSAAWVETIKADLALHGRPLEGGWPGTRSEARRLLARNIASFPARHPDRAHIERLVDAIYQGAKKAWEKQAVRQVSFDDDD